MLSNRSTEPKPVEKVADHTSGPILLPAIARLGLPVGIFGAAFFIVAILLTLLFSPDRFPVRVGDKTVRLHELEAEEKSLKIKQGDLTEERQKILANSDAPVLRQVQTLRFLATPIGSAMLAVEDIRQSFQAGTTDPISLSRVSFDAKANALVLAGEVSDFSGRSIQILATFVDELRGIAFFTSVSEPEYVSEPTVDGGTVSRFSLTLRFPHE